MAHQIKWLDGDRVYVREHKIELNGQKLVAYERREDHQMVVFGDSSCRYPTLSAAVAQLCAPEKWPQ